MRKLVYFDLEATGVDPHTDRIVEIALDEVSGVCLDGDAFDTRVNPGVPIPAEATAVHGISDEDVADSPTFPEIASSVQAIVSDAILVGYNSRSYDVVLLDAELVRAGQPGLPKDSIGRIVVPEIDPYRIWMEMEPRTLEKAAERFAGMKLDAHSAAADAGVLPFVLGGMCHEFGLDISDVDALQTISVPEGSVDRAGKFLREGDTIVFAFGPHNGESVALHADFLEWMTRKDFPPETIGIAHLLLDRIRRGAPLTGGAS